MEVAQILNKMKLGRVDKGKNCLFDEDNKHSTSDCNQLKDEIDALIHNGYLKEFFGKAS